MLVTQIRTSDSKREAIVDDEVLSVLRLIGAALDERRTVRVIDGGIVVLKEEPATTEEVEIDYGQRSRRPAAGSRQRTAGRERTPGGSRPPRKGSRVRSLVSGYERQLEDVEKAYPGAKLYRDEHGLWLFAPSLILEGIGRRAIFLMALPDTPEVEPRGWALWQEDGDLRWIGPRHTNFFDGSVCAFSSAKDSIWQPGDDLLTLLDIYSVWALRHLHLEIFGRWAGRQHALLDQRGEPDPYYRMIEFQPDELCSCQSGNRYGQCCRSRDLRHNLLTAKAAFERRHGGRSIRDRKPPSSVVKFAAGNGPIPAIAEAHEILRYHLVAKYRKKAVRWG